MKLLTAYLKNETCRGRLHGWLLSFIVCLATVLVRGTVVIPPTFDELVNQADYTVHAVVKSVSCEWRSTGTNLRIITKVELEVKEVISGNPPSPLVIEMLGGRIGDRQMIVHGSPEFKVGDEDILFIHGNGAQVNPLVALAHGRYPIKRDQQTGRAYVTRSNGDLLYDQQEVSQPLQSSTVHQERIEKPQPLSLELFTAKIRQSRKLPASAHEN